MIGFSRAVKPLITALATYVVLDIFLTPLGHLETRAFSGITTIGFAALGLLLAGLALAIISIVLLVRRSRVASVTASVAAVVYLPTAVTDSLGMFSRFSPPSAISVVEWIQVLVAAVTIALAVLLSPKRGRSSPGA